MRRGRGMVRSLPVGYADQLSSVQAQSNTSLDENYKYYLPYISPRGGIGLHETFIYEYNYNSGDKMGQAKWKSYSKEQLEKIVKESFSIREVARKLGYSENGGGTIASLKKMFQELNLDTSHFKGQGWNKQNYDYESFDLYTYRKNGKAIREPLIAIRGQKCECCGLMQWLNQPINLEVHHINGDRTDNRFENLQLLCPNCHSYTPTFTKKGAKREKTEDEFVQALRGSKSIRQALIFLDLTPCGGNYERAWYLIDKYNISHLKK